LPKTAAFARSLFTPNDATRNKIVEGDVLNSERPTNFDSLLLSHVYFVSTWTKIAWC
jgi:hypothetical protein